MRWIDNVFIAAGPVTINTSSIHLTAMQAYAFTKYLGHVRLEINDETGRLEILLLHFYMIQQLAWGAFISHYAFIFKWEYYLHELSIFQQVGLRAGQGHQFCLTPPLKKTQWWNKHFRWEITSIPSKSLSMPIFDNYYNYHTDKSVTS